MDNSIFDVTLRFDEMVLNYLKNHPACRYLFLSSGAAYGSGFNEPANRDTPSGCGDKQSGVARMVWYRKVACGMQASLTS